MDGLSLPDDFSDVVRTDETTVQLESHKRYCCRKQGATPKPKPRPKHPLKVHVWGGISTNGRTELVIFEGIMDASLYLEILKLVCSRSFVEYTQTATAS